MNFSSVLRRIALISTHSLPFFLPFTAFSLQPKVCMVLDKGGKDDHSFNESAVKGFESALAKLPIDKNSKFVEPKSDSQISQFLRSFSSSSDCALIIAVGFHPAEYIPPLAKQFTDKKFLVIDVDLDAHNTAHNIRSITFQENEGSFLVGAIAAMKSKSGKIGFVGGMDVPLIHRFELGYTSGAKYINPHIKFSASYVGITPDAWNNPARAKELALAQYNDGADVIFQVASNSGQGVFDAATQMDKANPGKKYYAIGVDSNQNWINPKVIITSMIKRVDVAIFSSIEDLTENRFETKHSVFDFKNKGVDWAYDKYNKGYYTPEEVKKIDDIKNQIIEGKIVVPDYYKVMKK